MAQVLKAAIIGMGKMGRIRMRELAAHPGFEVRAICDINETVAAEYPSMYFSQQWSDILQQDLDVVVVCTFNHIAPDIICAALEKGLHIFCEKPPGTSVADVERIRKYEKMHPGNILKFGFNHRFHYAVMEAKSLIDSGRYGRLLWARGIYGKAGGVSYEKSWRSDPTLAGGGILLDQGIHMLDLLRYFLGDFSEVKSFVENCFWKDVPLEDNAFALLKTGAGQVAMVHSSATHWKHRFNLDLFAEHGYICINGILSSTRSYGEESITFAKRQFEGETRAMGKPREETIYFDSDDSWRLEIEDFFDCIVGKKKNVAGDSNDALKVLQLIEDIYHEGQDAGV